jgi:DNA-binding transcriptional MerR regulator
MTNNQQQSQGEVNQHSQQFSLSELCVLTDLSVRTVRYYVQTGLVDRPDGGTKGAKYGARHLEQLLLTKKWSAAGVSLERIKELLRGEQAAIPPKARKAGSVEVCSHLYVADGVELVVEPSRAGLSPEQVRQFISGVMELYELVACGTGVPAGQP